MSKVDIPGYTYGTVAVPQSWLTLDELEELKKSVLFGDQDVAALRESLPHLAPLVDEILDVWYGFVGSNSHLVATFGRKSDGQPDEAYLAAVRKRFGQWILDTAQAHYDQRWLDYQMEIGRRHHTTSKNRTDGVAAADVVPLRHLIALIVPITFTLRPFLEKSGKPRDAVDRMHQAWVKSVTMQTALWASAYVKRSDY